MTRIVVLDGHVLNPGDLSWDGLAELGDLTVHQRTDPEDVAGRLTGYDCALTNKTVLGKTVLSGATTLKYVGVLATGYDVVDLAAARSLGLAVTNVPAYGSATVAQFAIGLLLEICHRIGHHDHAVHQGAWQDGQDWCFWDYPQVELAGKTLGLIGYGRIGQTTARIAQALGMRTIAYDPAFGELPGTSPTRQDTSRPQSEPATSGPATDLAADPASHPWPGPAERSTLPDLLTQSDFIALHCPLRPDTKELINQETIALMKDGVILINNARGQLVAESDLAAALNSGKVAAAGLDVMADEPIRPGNPLLTARNCLITPHISWASRESRGRLLEIAVNNLRQFLAGRPVNLVS
ncbi:MAG: D-2-hydroxyacid dehydrogenase [Bifidobacteriaceae bacterium]|jgi:glycerate dehydrogenase|nr:D-2-hydroxyacid dehydrogenase [Bifidobacteriaceae bacterium]